LIQIVTSENRHLFHDALTEMHRHRKATFIDQMGWPLTACADLEIDAFDCENAIYLIETDEAGAAVIQSARLLASDAPHLLADVFGALCEGGAPRAKDIFEASRFCPAPGAAKGLTRQRLLFKMIGAIMETSLLFGISRISFVASAALARRAGWDVEALGPTARVNGDKLTAMMASVNPEGLARVRALHGLQRPLARYATAPLRRAA
jgi:N-acyl-L-homoserine lactone synthetase